MKDSFYVKVDLLGVVEKGEGGRWSWYRGRGCGLGACMGG